MRKYITGEFVLIDDRIRTSQNMANKYNDGDRNAVVVGTHGFVTVQYTNGAKVDLDMRSIAAFAGRGE